jgi:hypothetical protein
MALGAERFTRERKVRMKSGPLNACLRLRLHHQMTVSRSRTIICLLILTALFLRVAVLKQHYNAVVEQDHFTAREAGVTYTVWGLQSGPKVLYIGDLLGTNIRSAQRLAEFKPPANLAAIVIPSIHPVKFNKVTPESFLGLISNERGVVLVENFCSKGPYCLSEPQTRLVDRLIKQYDVKQVNIYADNKMYVGFIGTFLKYLENMNISYAVIYP